MGASSFAPLATALADRYRIERELGAGGMATVYLAEDLKHKRRVAVKVLKPELAAVLGAERFVQEITTTAALQHPHILPLFDSGTADGFLYYVMPFIDGETLRARLNRETQLGVDEAVRIATDVADALHYAHTQGVIHRDIKPENILLANGRPMVADFGIALAVSAAAGGRVTETGLSLGTPHYMSPEQATADKEISARSDVYSLASVLYEMLAGQPPHLGGSAQQIIMKIIAEQPAAVTTIRKSVPPHVAAAVAKALEKLPADRFESAAKFAEALGNTAFTTSTARTAELAARPHRWATLAAVLVLGVVLGGVAVRSLPNEAAPLANAGREQLTFNGLAGRPAISADGRFVAYVETSCRHAGLSLCQSSLLLQEVGSTQPRVLLAGATDLRVPRWSHDGQTLIVAGELTEGREGLFALPRLTGTPVRIGSLGVYDTHPSADSVMLIPERATGYALVIVMSSGAVVDSIPFRFHDASEISWAPNGRHLAARMGDGVRIFARDGHPIDSISLEPRPVVRWNPEGTAVLFFRSGTVREDQFVQVRVGRDGRILGPAEAVVGRIPTLYRGEFDIARTTGALAVATGDANSDIWSFDLTATPVRGRRETRGTTWYGYPAASLDGRSIYYYRGDARGDNVYARNLETSVEEALTSQRLPGGEAMRLSYDGRRLVYGHSGSGRWLEYLELPSRQVFTARAPIWTDLVEPVSSRGFVSTDSRTGELVVLDSLSGTWRPIGISDSLSAANFAASPDGASLAVAAAAIRASETGSVYRAGAGGRRQVVGIVPVAGGEFRVLDTFATGEPEIGVSWVDSRTLSLSRWLDADELPSLWRLTIQDGRLTPMATLPAPCTPATVGLDKSGRMATCRVDDFRSDIWLMTVPGVTR